MEDTLPQRNSDGTFPAYAWPGGYPMLYLDGHNEVLCATCATMEADKEDPGNNALENWREYYKAKPYAVTEAQVLGFEHKDYVSPNVDAAMPYAVTLFAKYGTGQNAMRIPYAPAIPTLTGKQLRLPFKR